MRIGIPALFMGGLPLALLAASVDVQPSVPNGMPEATINLATDEGVRLVKGQWRYSDTKIVEVDFRGPGADSQPTGAPIKTYDYTPHAGAADFADSKWETIGATTLDKRRSTGRLCFINWYRINLTIPSRVGSYDPSGSTVVFETAIDDYAEIWVDGELSRALGQMGGSVIGGWNAPNRLVIGRDVKPGQKIQLAVFGANGPLSNPPTNFIWMRYARIGFHKGTSGPIAVTPREVNVEVVRLDPAIATIVGPNPKMFKLAEGFQFTEGPVWVRDGGYLVFSDPNANTQYGRPMIDEHGNRREIRIEKNGDLTVLADGYEGQRLNSPNDLVYRSDGTLYFTDPPFGLPKFFDDPRKELPYSGVYSLQSGKLRLISTDLKGPNGIAFSPDEKYLYVTNWDEKSKIVMRYEADADGTLANGKVFFDMTGAPGEDALDGMKVDKQGNLYVSGPGGLWILSAEGKHLGMIAGPKHPHNFAWRDEDGKTLYLCARSGLYKMRLNIPGIRP